MRVALFVPCYIDQFYPAVAIATMQLLENLGVDVVYPPNQTCCGQPMANAGFEDYASKCNKLFIKNFSNVTHIVCPSGSCVLHIKERLHDITNESAALQIKENIFELTEYLIDILKVEKLNAKFPFKVAMHQGCHGLRGLNLASMSEVKTQPFSKPLQLLNMVNGIEIVEPGRVDECCGFGGTFCVSEEAVSVKMGKDRIEDFDASGAEVITSTDMSCLMHLEGILKRQKTNIAVKHIAEILTVS